MAPNQRIFFVAHNRNHVRIFAGAAQSLRASGHDVRFAGIDGADDVAAALSAATALGFATFPASRLVKAAHPGDVVCVGNDWGPKFFRQDLRSLARKGVRRIGIVEGARFGKAGHYLNVDRVLCWGPSGMEMANPDKVVVGSPAVEAAVRNEAQPTRPSALINYKFTRGAVDIGPDWARMAARAAEAAGIDYVISAHPLNVAALAGLSVSAEAFVSLLPQSTLLITRGSTAIYEALAARVNVIYLPIKDEWRSEFADPMGAFEIAETGAELEAATAAHAKSFAFDAGKAAPFLNRHIDIDTNRPALTRMAEAIASFAALEAPTPVLPSMFARLSNGFGQLMGRP